MFHKDKENCFAEKAITNNHRKTFAKLVKTIAAKVLVFCSFTKQSLILSYTYFSNVTTKSDHLQGSSAARKEILWWQINIVIFKVDSAFPVSNHNANYYPWREMLSLALIMSGLCVLILKLNRSGRFTSWRTWLRGFISRESNNYEIINPGARTVNDMLILTRKSQK